MLVRALTRPLRLSDLVAGWRRLRRRPVEARPRPDFEATRLIDRGDDDTGWLSAARAARGVDVSEEPLHTLPAELQEEFTSRPAPLAPAPAPAPAPVPAPRN